MSGTCRHGRLNCQMADCRNRMTRTVKLELPVSWSDAREYTVSRSWWASAATAPATWTRAPGR
jgi:hypothetical protein